MAHHPPYFCFAGCDAMLSCVGNRVGNEGAAKLGEALQHNTSLTSLHMRCTEEGSELLVLWREFIEGEGE